MLSAAICGRVRCWDFIKYMQDPGNNTDVEDLYGFMPAVYRPLLYYRLERDVTGQFSEYEREFGWRSTLSPQQAVDNVFASLDRLYQMPMSNMSMYYAADPVSLIIDEVMYEFFFGGLTAEQAAEEIQERITLVLME